MVYDIIKKMEEKIPQFVIRGVRFEDMENLCNIYKKYRKEKFQSIVDQEYLDNFSRNPKVWWSFLASKKDQEYCLFVYEIFGKAVGFIEGGKSNKEDFDFEIYGFYVDPDTKKEGIGKRLFHHFIGYQRSKSRRNFYLWTFKDNLKWIEFYKKFGGRLIEEKKRKLGDREYDFVCYTFKEEQ